MDALSSSSFLATFHHPSRRPLFRISAVRTEEKPLRTTIHRPDKPSTTTPIKTTTTQPQIQKSSSPRSSPPPPPAGGRSLAPPPSIQAALCNALDFLINNFVDPAVHRPSVDPRHVLSNNWAPRHPARLSAAAYIPHCLAGVAYIRNGPNPQHLPHGPHHLFDDDGMLRSLLLPSTSATGDAVLCSRYVQTYRYILEREAGAPVFISIFAGFHGAGGIARGAGQHQPSLPRWQTLRPG